MIASMPFILYRLPKSRTTQSLKEKKVEAAWQGIKVFLTSCTDADPLHPQINRLTAYAPYHTDKSPERAKRTIDELKGLFGRGETYAISTGCPKQTSWRMEPAHFSKALDYMIAGQPWPPAAFGPIEWLLAYDFALIDPTTKEKLPNQEIQSSIMFWLGRSSSCSMTFGFLFKHPAPIFGPI